MQALELFEKFLDWPYFTESRFFAYNEKIIKSPAQLSIEICKLSNQDALDYVNGEAYEKNLSWLPDTHYRASFTHNVAAGLHAKFDSLYPYHHDWQTVRAVFPIFYSEFSIPEMSDHVTGS